MLSCQFLFTFSNRPTADKPTNKQPYLHLESTKVCISESLFRGNSTASNMHNTSNEKVRFTRLYSTLLQILLEFVESREEKKKVIEFSVAFCL